MILPDLSTSNAVGRAIGGCLRRGDVVTLSGPLGAGKTTIARAMIEALGLTGEAASPTYPIVIAYDPPDVRVPVAHVDLYRIDDPDQLSELGLDELRETSAMIIEWPERVPVFAEALALTLTIGHSGSSEGEDTATRRLTATVPDGWKDRWPFQ